MKWVAASRRGWAVTSLLALALGSTPAWGQSTDYKTPEPEPEPKPKPSPEPTGSNGDSGGDSGGDSSSSGGGDTGARSRRKASGLMPPATNPWYLTAGVGPTFFGLTKGGKGRGGAGGPGSGLRRERFIVGLDLGYHFSGEFEGPAIGLAVEQSFDADFYAFNSAFKFLWDIQLFDDMGVYIAPFVKAGYALGCDYGSCGVVHAFNVGLGVEGRIVFNDFPVVFFRPIQLDSFLGDFYNETFLLNYSILVGGGMTF